MTTVDHGLTLAELAQLSEGQELHFTNHPCRPSVPVTLLSTRGLVRRENGQQVHAFADELSRQPRAGLGQ